MIESQHTSGPIIVSKNSFFFPLNFSKPTSAWRECVFFILYIYDVDIHFTKEKGENCCGNLSIASPLRITTQKGPLVVRVCVYIFQLLDIHQRFRRVDTDSSHHTGRGKPCKEERCLSHCPRPLLSSPPILELYSR